MRRAPARSVLTARRVYLACPIPAFWTERYEVRLAHLRRLAPVAEIVEPRLLPWDNPRWLAGGRGLIATCDALVVFGLGDRSVGLGVAQELEWAAADGVPAWELTGRGALRPDPRAVPLPRGTLQRWARLEVGA